MNSKLRILVVDDDAVLRKMIASLFTTFADVAALESGQEAIAFLQHTVVDIVFSDVCMPEGDGIELLEWTHRHLAHPPVFILVTGQSILTSDDALSKGAYALVQKPFKVKDLVTIAREIEQKIAS